MNLFRFFVFLFLTSFSSVLFFSLHTCFCSSRFAFTSFFIRFFVWPFIFLISFFLNSFCFASLSLTFFEQQVPFLFASKTLQLFTFCMHALPLYVLLLFIDLFICCLFFSSCWTSSQICMFLHVRPFSQFFSFLCILLFFWPFLNSSHSPPPIQHLPF